MFEALCTLDNQKYEAEDFEKDLHFDKKKKNLVCERCGCRLIYKSKSVLENGKTRKAHFAGKHTEAECNPSKSTKRIAKINKDKRIITILARKLSDEALYDHLDPVWLHEDKLQKKEKPDNPQSTQMKRTTGTMSAIAKKLRDYNDAERFDYLYNNLFRFRGGIKETGVELFRRYDEVTESDLYQKKAVYGIIDNLGFKYDKQKIISSIWLNFTQDLSDYALLVDKDHLGAFLKENNLENNSEEEIKQKLEGHFVLCITKILKTNQEKKRIKNLFSFCDRMDWMVIL